MLRHVRLYECQNNVKHAKNGESQAHNRVWSVFNWSGKIDLFWVIACNNSFSEEDSPGKINSSRDMLGSNSTAKDLIMATGCETHMQEQSLLPLQNLNHYDWIKGWLVTKVLKGPWIIPASVDLTLWSNSSSWFNIISDGTVWSI